MQTRYMIVYEDEGQNYKFVIRASNAQEALDAFTKSYGNVDVLDIYKMK